MLHKIGRDEKRDFGVERSLLLHMHSSCRLSGSPPWFEKGFVAIVLIYTKSKLLFYVTNSNLDLGLITNR